MRISRLARIAIICLTVCYAVIVVVARLAEKSTYLKRTGDKKSSHACGQSDPGTVTERRFISTGNYTDEISDSHEQRSPNFHKHHVLHINRGVSEHNDLTRGILLNHISRNITGNIASDKAHERELETEEGNGKLEVVDEVVAAKEPSNEGKTDTKLEDNVHDETKRGISRVDEREDDKKSGENHNVDFGQDNESIQTEVQNADVAEDLSVNSSVDATNPPPQPNQPPPPPEPREKHVGLIEQVGWKSFTDPHNYRYIINPKEKCAEGGDQELVTQNITLLVLVHTAPQNVKRREVIRRTWMRVIKTHNISTKALFLLGSTEDQEIQDGLYKEADAYGDIVQEDFKDSYYNLSVKTIMGFKWAALFCQNTVFMMKTDDDVVINIATLTNDLTDAPLPYRTNYVVGLRTAGVGPVRNVYSKWYTPEYMYPGDSYPPYPQGHGYIISIDVADKLYRLSTEVPLFPWEDVFVGILLEKLGIDTVMKNSFYLTFCLFDFFHERKDPWTLIRTNTTLLVLQKGYYTFDMSTGYMEQIWNTIENNVWPTFDGKDLEKCTKEYVEGLRYLP